MKRRPTPPSSSGDAEPPPDDPLSARGRQYAIQRRVEESGFTPPTAPLSITIGEEEIDLADQTRFPQASVNRTAWLADLQKKIPPPDRIERIEFDGDDFTLRDEEGNMIPWNDGQERYYGPYRR